MNVKYLPEKKASFGEFVNILQVILLLLEVFNFSIWIWDNRICARLPTSWTNLAMLVGVLEGLNKTKSFIHRTTYRQIVHRDLTENALVVDDEETS